jgi:phosphotransacetylase
MAEMASYHKLLFITDAAINIQPDVRAKAEILQNAVNLTWWLGNKRARVAALSAIEMVNPAIPSTLDAACLAINASIRAARPISTGSIRPASAA